MANTNKFSLFGFTISRQQDENDKVVQQSFAPPTSDDGALTITSAAYYGTYVDLDGTAKNEVELISRYREMAMQPEIESAIDDIVNEAIVQDDDGKITQIVLDDLKQPDKIKKAIKEEFSTILRLFNYQNMAQDIFRRYYIDGRMYYHYLMECLAVNKLWKDRESMLTTTMQVKLINTQFKLPKRIIQILSS